MIHGECSSIGCLAVGGLEADRGQDYGYIDEIWTIAEAAGNNGQSFFPVHVFPFPMTRQNIDTAVRQFPQHADFWQEILPGYDAFERTRRVPEVAQGRRYSISSVGSPIGAGFDDRSRIAVAPFENSWDGNGMMQFPPKGQCAEGAVWRDGACVRMGLMERNQFLAEQRRREQREREGSQPREEPRQTEPRRTEPRRDERQTPAQFVSPSQSFSARTVSEVSVRRSERLEVIPTPGYGRRNDYTMVRTRSGQTGMVPSSILNW